MPRHKQEAARRQVAARGRGGAPGLASRLWLRPATANVGVPSRNQQVHGKHKPLVRVTGPSTSP